MVAPVADRALRQDIPASPAAYESYLRATRFGDNHETMHQARDLYLECLQQDPNFALAWARLGRVCRCLGNWGDRAEAPGNSKKSEDALRRALDLSPDLSLAQHYYAYLELDLGRAQEAMLRLLAGAKQHPADPELLAVLVHALRYCGLLDASVAAYEKAVRLDPNATTSVSQTFWMLGDTHRAVETESQVDRMMGMLAALQNDQTAPVLAQLKRRASKLSGAVSVNNRAFIAVLEQDREAFTGPFDALVDSTRDPENLYYMSLMAAFVVAGDRCLSAVERAVRGGSVLRPLPTSHGSKACETRRVSPRSSPRRRPVASAPSRPSGPRVVTGCSGSSGLSGHGGPSRAGQPRSRPRPGHRQRRSSCSARAGSCRGEAPCRTGHPFP